VNDEVFAILIEERTFSLKKIIPDPSELD